MPSDRITNNGDEIERRRRRKRKNWNKNNVTIVLLCRRRQFENVNKIPQYFGICADLQECTWKQNIQNANKYTYIHAQCTGFVSRVFYQQYLTLCMYTVHEVRSPCTKFDTHKMKYIVCHSPFTKIANFRCFHSIRFDYLFISYYYESIAFRIDRLSKPNKPHTVSSHIVNISHINSHVHILMSLNVVCR